MSPFPKGSDKNRRVVFEQSLGQKSVLNGEKWNHCNDNDSRLGFKAERVIALNKRRNVPWG